MWPIWHRFLADPPGISQRTKEESLYMAINDNMPMPDRLIEVAVKLFAEKGYDATSVADIVETAGVTKGALYHYYTSKDELLSQIHRRFITAEIKDAQRIMAQGWGPRETLRHLIISLVESIVSYRFEVTVFFREMHRLPSSVFDEIKQARDDYAGFFEKTIRQGQELGEFRHDSHPRMMTLALFGACNWMYTWYNPDGPFSARKIGEQLADIIMDGLSCPG